MPGGRQVNLKEGYTKHYEYDVHNQLVHEYMVLAEEPGVRDAERVFLLERGRRVAVLERQGENFALRHLLLPDPASDRMLAEQYVDATASHTIWPLHDRQGTVTAAVSADWFAGMADVQHFEYDAFGTLRFDREQDPSLGRRLVSLHAGRDWDSEAALYHNRARWYDPALERFISQDPLGFAAGDANLYRYCFNSPANFTDPSGLAASFWNDPLEWAYGQGGAIWDVHASTSTAGWIYRDYLAEGTRATLGDAYLSQAGGWELIGVTGVGVTAGVLGGYAAIPLAAALGLGGLGTAMLAGGMAGGAEYLGMTLTAAGCNAHYGYGANVGPTFAGLGVSVGGGAIGGGVFHGAGVAIGAGFRTMGRGFAAVDRGLAAVGRRAGAYVDDLVSSGLPMFALPGGGAVSPARAIAVARVAAGVLAVPPPTFLGPMGGLYGSHIAMASAGNTPAGRAAGQTVGDLRVTGSKDAHHVIQDAAVRDIPGYNTNAAPGVQLPGSSTARGTPHYNATQVQRQLGGGTYAAERRIGYKALRRAGLSKAEARRAIQQADDYFRSLGVGPETLTRIPGNRQ